MAIDEAVFRICQRRAMSPTLRFYGWSVPTVSLGYFQKVHEEINLQSCRDMGIDVIRRPTGGKAVLHEKDLTYSVVAQTGKPFFPGGLLETYRIISSCIAKGLAQLGIEACMSEGGQCATQAPLEACCFSTPSQYELLVKGKKICGSAQVRSKGAFLQHGSLQVDFDPYRTFTAIGKPLDAVDRNADRLRRRATSVNESGDRHCDYDVLCSVLAEGFEEHLGIHLVRGALTVEETTLMQTLVKYKYSDSEWNMEGKTSR